MEGRPIHLRLDLSTMAGSPLPGEEGERTVAGSLELTVRLKKGVSIACADGRIIENLHIVATTSNPRVVEVKEREVWEEERDFKKVREKPSQFVWAKIKRVVWAVEQNMSRDRGGIEIWGFCTSPRCGLDTVASDSKSSWVR